MTHTIHNRRPRNTLLPSNVLRNVTKLGTGLLAASAAMSGSRAEARALHAWDSASGNLPLAPANAPGKAITAPAGAPGNALLAPAGAPIAAPAPIAPAPALLGIDEVETGAPQASPVTPVDTFNSTVDGVHFCAPEPTNLTSIRFVNAMSHDDLTTFATAMTPFIDHDLVTAHYQIDHSQAETFFYAHRRYIQCVENYLGKSGINLPIWDPATPVPAEIQGVKRSPVLCESEGPDCDAGWMAVGLDNVNPQIGMPDALTPANLCNVRTLQDLFQQTTNWHGTVHITVGGPGTFATFDSPAALLFFPWHKFIDTEILARWEACPQPEQPAPVVPTPGPAPAPGENGTPACEVNVRLDTPWQQQGVWYGGVNLGVSNPGTKTIAQPWNFTVAGDHVGGVMHPWNWRPVNGSLSGVADQSWQTLQHNAANTVDLGYIGVGNNATLTPDFVMVNNLPCKVKVA